MLRLLIFSMLCFVIAERNNGVVAQEATKASVVESTELGNTEATVQAGINDRFLDPELDLSEWVGRFEIESREVYSARESIGGLCDQAWIHDCRHRSRNRVLQPAIRNSRRPGRLGVRGRYFTSVSAAYQ